MVAKQREINANRFRNALKEKQIKKIKTKRNENDTNNRIIFILKMMSCIIVSIVRCQTFCDDNHAIFDDSTFHYSQINYTIVIIVRKY